MFSNVLLVLAIGLVFWGVVVQPDRAEQRALRKRVMALQPGDWVMASDILGRVVRAGTSSELFHVEVCPGVVLRCRWSAITRVLDGAPPKAELDVPAPPLLLAPAE